MKHLSLISQLLLGFALAGSAQAQFSVTGGGSLIPPFASGGGGFWPVAMPTSPAVSVANVPIAVTSIHRIEIQGLRHGYVGDLQMVLVDPLGVGHNFVVRPGVDHNGSAAGSSRDFAPGDFTFIEIGGATLPMDSSIGNALMSGFYNQSFTTGTTLWPSGQAGIFNTPLSQIKGPAGNWTLMVYDWWESNTGEFLSWRLVGNSPNGNSGTAYCFGDGSGALCPCSAFGTTGRGCTNSSGTGAILIGMGVASVITDNLQLTVRGAPENKPGLFFQGTNQVALPVGDGVLCSNSTLRYAVNGTDANGEVTQGGFSANASSGSSFNYQYWFRDPANNCGNGFNFSNGWMATWL